MFHCQKLRMVLCLNTCFLLFEEKQITINTLLYQFLPYPKRQTLSNAWVKSTNERKEFMQETQHTQQTATQTAQNQDKTFSNHGHLMTLF